MSEISVTSQYLYTGQGPLDKKLEPVQSVSGLYNIPRTERYEGMTIVVLDEHSEYWLSGGTSDLNWVKKSVAVEVSLSGDGKTIAVENEKISLKVADSENNAIQSSGSSGIFISMVVDDPDF